MHIGVDWRLDYVYITWYRYMYIYSKVCIQMSVDLKLYNVFFLCIYRFIIYIYFIRWRRCGTLGVWLLSSDDWYVEMKITIQLIVVISFNEIMIKLVIWYVPLRTKQQESIGLLHPIRLEGPCTSSIGFIWRLFSNSFIW